MKRSPSFVGFALALPLVLGLVVPAAQEPEPVEIPAAELAAARAVFGAVGKRLADVRELHADYVQRQESLLLDEPLVSRGRFHLALDRGVLVLDLTEPVETRIRSDATTHRIHHVAERRAEVFRFRENRVTKALLACFSADLARVEEVFWIAGHQVSEVEREGQEPLRLATVALIPKEPELAAFIASLTVVFDRDRQVPLKVQQRNREGELVQFELADVELVPRTEEPRASLFDRELPPGTRSVETRVR
ncbi:MAG: outer membrane lipoprotein carrier protein LolA [Planctomycetota bacterium]